MYVKGELVYGTEPASSDVETLALASGKVAPADTVFKVSLLQNPVRGNEVEVRSEWGSWPPDRNGVDRCRRKGDYYKKREDGSHGRRSIVSCCKGSNSGVFYLKVNMDRQTKIVKVIRL